MYFACGMVYRLWLESCYKTVLQPVEDMQNPFEREKIQCILCRYKIVPDYKNVKLLSQFVSPYTGRIYGRHITRLCAAQQARLEKEILKSQSAGWHASVRVL
jgi:ribosomal protein S18